MTNEEQDLMTRVRELEDKLVLWTSELVAIPTVNPYSGDASAATEAPGQDWIAGKLTDLGATVRRVPVPPDVYARGGIIGPADRSWEGRENVVGEWALGSGAGPCIVLNDHMDTVGTEGMGAGATDPVVEDGRMHGRGTSDTKGNLVMGLMAVEALLGQGGNLNGRIVLESVVDEECNGAGAGTLACCLAGIRGDLAICLDGSVGTLINGCNGIATARVGVRGLSGHSSQGVSVSAIDKGIAVKQAIDAFGDAHSAAYPSCLVNVGIFRSGTLPAIVPGEAELQLNLSYPIEDARKAYETEGVWDGRVFRTRFEQAMAGLADRDPWFQEQPVTVSWIKDMYPFECEPDTPLIQLALATASEVYGRAVDARPMPAWFDAAHLARHLGVPVLGMGCGTPGCAHSATEYVVLEDLFRGARTLALLLQRLLS